jgi:hypothetical protein
MPPPRDGHHSFRALYAIAIAGVAVLERDDGSSIVLAVMAAE